jgi:hypothetical protein
MKLLKIQAQECVREPHGGLRPPCTQQDSLPERIPEHTLLSSQRWAKMTTLRALTIFLEALFQLEKRLGGWNGA